MALKIGVILDTMAGVPESVKQAQKAMDKLQAEVRKRPLNMMIQVDQKNTLLVRDLFNKTTVSAKELKAAIEQITVEYRKLDAANAFGKGGNAAKSTFENNLKYLNAMLAGIDNLYAKHFTTVAKWNAKNAEMLNMQEIQLQAEEQLLQQEALTLDMVSNQIQAASHKLTTMKGNPALISTSVSKDDIAAYEEATRKLVDLKRKYDEADAAAKRFEASIATGDGTIDKTQITIKSMQKAISMLRSGMENLNLKNKEQREAFMQYGLQIQKVTAELNKYLLAQGRATTKAGSIDRLSVEMQALNTQWNAMSAKQRESSKTAQKIIEKYKQLVKLKEEEALSLDKVLAKEKQLQAELLKRERNQRRVTTAQRQYEYAMKETAKNAKLLNFQISVLTKRKMHLPINSAEFKAVETRLMALRAQLNALSNKTEDTGTRAKRQLKQVNQELNISGSYVGRLLVRLGLYSGIFAAFRAVRNIREVTAEFEMQRVALGGIIQDTYKADQLFQRLKAAAIKSPFEIKDLVSYVKQLSAYRIETSKLYDTTMKLADVSAGLGVDMSRLILAFGQVRAASVLRGQELRQFTEAGVPLVELLADKFTKLRGELVSTGEVFDLISKREVPFEMVSEIFDDMTKKGGTFYKMQEKQAQTLQGQWTNLKDAISIMYDEIGRTDSVSEGMMSLIGVLKKLASSWKNVATAAMVMGGGSVVASSINKFLTVQTANTKLADKATARLALSERVETAAKAKGSATMMTYSRNLQKSAAMLKLASTSTSAFTRVSLRLRAALMAINPTTAIITAAITAFTAALSFAINRVRDAREYMKETDRIMGEASKRVERLTTNFKRLAQIATSDTSLKKRKEALEEINRTYSDYLPQLDEETLRVNALGGTYKSLIDVMTEKIRLQSIEEKMSAATSIYGGRAENKRGTITQGLRQNGVSPEVISEFFDSINEEIEKGNGEMYKNLDKLMSLMSQISGESDALAIGKYLANGKMGYIAMRRYIVNTMKMQEQLAELEKEMSGSSGLGKYASMYKKMFQDPKKEMEGLDDTYAKVQENVKRNIGNLATFIRAVFKDEKVSVSEELFSETSINLDGILKSLGDTQPRLKKLIKGIKKDYDDLVMSDKTSLAIKSQFENIVNSMANEKLKVNMDTFKGMLKTDGEGVQEWSQKVIDAATAARKAYNDALTTNRLAGKDGKKYSEDEIARLKLKAEINERLAKDVAKQYHVDKSKSDPQLEALKEELSVLNKVYSAYKEYEKQIGKVAAKERVQSEFAASIANLRFGAGFNASEMIAIKKRYQQLIGTGTADRKKANIELGLEIDKETFNESQENITNSLAALKDRISRSQVAKNFFNDILSMTGSEAVAKEVTMQVYGEVGDDLSESMIEQVQKVFDGIDISGAINGDKINYNALAQKIPSLPKSQQSSAWSIVNEGRKENAEWIKEVRKTYEKAKTYEEQITEVRRVEAQKRKEIAKSGDPEKESLMAASFKKEQQEVAKIQMEALKNTEAWTMVFDDIEKVGTSSVKNLYNILNSFIKKNIGKLSAEEIKTLTNELKKLESGIYSKDPMKSVVDGIKEVVQAAKQLKQARQGAFVDLSGSGVANAENALNTAIEKTKSGLSGFSSQIGAIGDVISEVGAAVADIWSYFDEDEADEAQQFISDLTSGFNSAVKVVAALSAALTGLAIAAAVTGASFGWITAIVGGVALLVGGLKALFNIKDDRLESQIQDITDKIEVMDKTLEDLEESMEKVFGSEYLQNTSEQLEILQAEATAYQKQADLERDKKKSDEDKAKEYEEQAEAAIKKIAQLKEEIVNQFAGTDITSAARDFASAWIDAYKSYSSTTDAIKEKFNDMIDNMIVESLAAQIMKDMLDPVFKAIETATDDKNVTANEISEIADLAVEQAEGINTAMLALTSKLSAAGLNVRATGTSTTGIAKDVASASEESITGLAANINAQNYYISSIRDYVAQILEALQGGSTVQQARSFAASASSGDTNYMASLPVIEQHTADILAECKAAASDCRSIAENLNRVIKPKGSSSGYVVNIS